jgi:putative acetyltransferase
MTIGVRPFRPQDAAPTWATFHDAIRIGAQGVYTTAELDGWCAEGRPMPEDWAGRLGRHLTLIGEREGALAGFFMLEADGYLNLVFVRPEHHRQGIAAALHDATLDLARSLGIPRLTVWASRMLYPVLTRRGWQIDPAPAPRAGYPAPSTTQTPIHWPLTRAV